MRGVMDTINQRNNPVEYGWMSHMNPLTPKHWEMYGCVVSKVATDALVLKHQAISIHNAD